MRCLVGFICVLALSAMGCAEGESDGGIGATFGVRGGGACDGFGCHAA